MRVAVVQMNSAEDKAQNLSTAERLLHEAADRGAELAVLPELFTYLGRRGKHKEVAETIPGSTSELLTRIARERRIHLVGGSFLESASGHERLFNTSLAIDTDGAIVARYRKLHLFDVDVDGRRYRESDTMAPGEDVVLTKLGDTPVGLTICYDLRFPELYRRLGTGGARIITAPSAFTFETGKDHWDLLVRTRALENQVFVLAAAQVGSHPPGLACWGNAMIVDPWGTVLARAPEAECVVLADIDFEHQDRIRASLPALSHRRTEILGL
jgi:deaminated glutathione amidase